jgi:uncharacterized protein (TIGR00251 family)
VSRADPAWYRWNGTILHVELQVRPRASRDGAAGLHGGRLRIDVRAPPVDDKANERLVRWFAAEFGVARRAVRLRGAKGRMKSVGIESPARIPAWFTALAARDETPA